MKLLNEISKVRKVEFQKKVLSYFKATGRSFPWRDTINPYCILVSEIMLQQTQAERVILHYPRFIERFPDFKSLSVTSVHEALCYWSGLGFPRRLLNLLKLSVIVTNSYSGILPQSREELQRLPGIGAYTSAAVIAFWLNKKSPVIDTNISKVFEQEFPGFMNLSLKEKESFVYMFIPNGKSRIWNNALMDYAKSIHRGNRVEKKTRQKPFIGSERQIRGKILKLLLGSVLLSKEEILRVIDDGRCEKLLTHLEAEGFISISSGKVELNRSGAAKMLE